MTELSAEARRFDWLITEFVTNTPGVAHAVVVSSDGLRLAQSEGFPPDRADQLAAVAAGLLSLTVGASRVFEGGPVTQTIVEMQRGLRSSWRSAMVRVSPSSRPRTVTWAWWRTR